VFCIVTISQVIGYEGWMFCIREIGWDDRLR